MEASFVDNVVNFIYNISYIGMFFRVLYQNACIITIFCTFLPCRIDEIGTRDEWMVAGIVDGLFVFCIFYFHMNVVNRKMGLDFSDGAH
jgi:hypothetical protein